AGRAPGSDRVRDLAVRSRGRAWARRWPGAIRGGGFARRLLYSPAMPKVCHVCAKGPAFGNSRSHSMVATRRRFEPNLQRVRIDDGGTPRRVYVCTRCLKAGKVAKAR
ncbi:MAG: 50S ribosomal protein L28, partial [Solirubrobacteraceae bacterium]